MKKKLLLGHILPLMIGGLIYLAFRTDSLLMFKWFDAILLDTPIEYLREMTLTSSKHLPNWFLFSLPDGLWIFSYISLTLVIWRNKITKQNVFWILIIPCFAIISELGQSFKIVSGTFDYTDLTFYFLGVITPLVLFKNSLIFKTKKS